ncbi:hypothetical protein K3495_g16230 [Podosphaera aphanis]|nr:hypothetical protein K3495_g16230 [Podosphaera aphanis]
MGTTAPPKRNTRPRLGNHWRKTMPTRCEGCAKAKVDESWTRGFSELKDRELDMPKQSKRMRETKDRIEWYGLHINRKDKEPIELVKVADNTHR